LMRVGHGQGVKSVRVIWIFFERPFICSNRLFKTVLSEKLHPFVVMIFSVHVIVVN
jgi:hypothetical protein